MDLPRGLASARLPCHEAGPAMRSRLRVLEAAGQVEVLIFLPARSVRGIRRQCVSCPVPPRH